MDSNEIIEKLKGSFLDKNEAKDIIDRLNDLEAKIQKEKVDTETETPEEVEIKFWKGVIRKATGDLDTIDNGDALVPTVVMDKIHIALQKADWVRRYATVQTASYKEDIPILKTGATGYWVADGSAPTASVLNADTISFKSNRLAVMTTTSNILMSNASPSILNAIYTAFANAIANEDRKVAITGDGSGKWEGLQAASIATITALSGHTTIDDLTYDDIMNLFMGVPSQYRYLPDTKFILHGSTLGVIRKITDNNNQPIFLPRENKIFGAEVIEDENMPTTGTSNPVIYFGYMKDYWVIDRQGAKISTTNQGLELVSKQQTLVYMDMLTDAHLIDATGWRGLVLASS